MLDYIDEEGFARWERRRAPAVAEVFETCVTTEPELWNDPFAPVQPGPMWKALREVPARLQPATVNPDELETWLRRCCRRARLSRPAHEVLWALASGATPAEAAEVAGVDLAEAEELRREAVGAIIKSAEVVSRDYRRGRERVRHQGRSVPPTGGAQDAAHPRPGAVHSAPGVR